MTTTTTLHSFAKKALISKNDAYVQELDAQKKRYGEFDFSEFSSPRDRAIQLALRSVEEITERKIFRDFNRHKDFAEFLGILRAMAQSKTKWTELSEKFQVPVEAFASYYKIMGNLPWYNTKTHTMIGALSPNWEHVENYVMYMASRLNITLDYNKFSRIFNEETWEEWVEETQQEVESLYEVHEHFEKHDDEPF